MRILRSLLRRRSAACSSVLPQSFAGSVESSWTNVQLPPLLVDVQERCRNGNSTVVSLWKTFGQTGWSFAKYCRYSVLVCRARGQDGCSLVHLQKLRERNRAWDQTRFLRRRY